MSVRPHRFTPVLLRHLLALILALLAIPVPRCSAQSDGASEEGTIRGAVLNSVTREPISGALVISPDSHFAARTDSQGRFEFTIPKAEPTPSPAPEGTGTAEGPGVSTSVSVAMGATLEQWPNRESTRPTMLSARKPGFLETSNLSAMDLAQRAKEITLFLVPEAVIAGHISLPSSEAPDKIGLQFFRRLVQNGIAQWVPAGNTTSKSNGDFRFAELMPGTYKLLTRELLDRDPLNANSHAQQYGYPPVYYPDADDFASAAEIRLSPGEVSEPRLTLVKQPYYSVKIAVANTQPSTFGMNVNVASQKGHAGPGYALNYDSSTQTIEGLLPNGTYTVEASSFGRSSAAGAITLVVKGAAVTGAKLALEPAASVVINVREEFANKPPETPFTFTQGRRSLKGRGAVRYLNVSLESADEFNFGRNGFLRPPSGPDDTALEIQDVLPGRYWVRVRSAYGYAAVVRSGSTNLLRDPLVVGAGGATIPVEITMRDDSAQIAGQVEQLAAAPAPVVRGLPPAFVYCVPTPDSTGQFAEMGVLPDGTFTSPPLVPGEYRVLAFDRQQSGLEYRNPEAMKLYDGKGPVVEVAGGQTEHVTLQLNSTRE